MLPHAPPAQGTPSHHRSLGIYCISVWIYYIIYSLLDILSSRLVFNLIHCLIIVSLVRMSHAYKL